MAYQVNLMNTKQCGVLISNTRKIRKRANRRKQISQTNNQETIRNIKCETQPNMLLKFISLSETLMLTESVTRKNMNF